MKKNKYYRDPKPAADLLESRPFKRVMHRAKHLMAIDEVIRDTLGPEIATHCRCADYANGTLHLAVDNSSWTTKLRFAELDLLEALRLHSTLSYVKRIKCRVQVTDPAKPSASVTIKRSISPRSKEHIRQMSESISDEALKKALLKLGQ